MEKFTKILMNGTISKTFLLFQVLFILFGVVLNFQPLLTIGLYFGGAFLGALIYEVWFYIELQKKIRDDEKNN